MEYGPAFIGRKFTITSVGCDCNRSDDVLDIMKRGSRYFIISRPQTVVRYDNNTRDKQPTFIIGNLESDVVVVQVDTNGTVYNAEKCRWRLVPYAVHTVSRWFLYDIGNRSDAAAIRKTRYPLPLRRQYADRAGDCAGSR